MEDLAYRQYVAETLRLQGEQKYITIKFIDIIRPQEEINEDEGKTAFEIASGISEHLGLTVIHKTEKGGLNSDNI